MNTPKYVYHEGKAVPLDERMKRVDKLAELLDSRWKIPGTEWRIGLDGILGFIPGIGDTIGAAISSYLIYEAHQSGAPFHLILRMLFNLFIDWLVGLIPLVGDIFDIGWKANLRNAHLLRRFMAKQHGTH